MKVLILGDARHGKDTLAELLEKYYGVKYKSSSQAAADIFIYAKLGHEYGYTTPEECFQDRVNHRVEWHDLISDYNKDDRARLAKGILEHADCYVGMRCHKEVDECRKQGLFDLIVWVDASERLPKEGKDSFDIEMCNADMIIENNGTLLEFDAKVKRVFDLILSRKVIYIAGGMRGHEYYDFPNFMAKQKDLEDEGWEVINPAQLDLDNGLDPYTFPVDFDWSQPPPGELLPIMERDTMSIIHRCDAIYMRKGWVTSTGSRAEHALAEWKGCEIIYEK